MNMREVVGVVLCIGCAGAAAAAGSNGGPESATIPAGRISPAEAAVLGVIEGLTEYLPVSSTGHLILANNAMGLSRVSEKRGPMGRQLEKVPAVDAFDIVIQLGAVLAVLGLYRKRVAQMARGLVGRDRIGRGLLVNLAIAFLPAAVVGLLFHHWIKENLFAPLTVALALAVGGVLMIAVEHFFWRRRKATRMEDVGQVRLWQAFVIGLAQCAALWPGTSRSMITIVAALVVGLDRRAAAEFSFLLALPTLGAATVYEGFKSWHVLAESAGPAAILVGLVVSGVVAALAVKGFVRWLTRHGLLAFGIYRIALAGAVFAYFTFL